MYAELKLKVCSKCKEEKSLNNFFNDKRRKDLLSYHCKACHKQERAEDRMKNPEKWKRLRHKYLLTEKFNITVDKYNQMFDEQTGRCAICGKHQSELKKRLFVDHDHTTGEVRSLLCFKCNFALGQLQDSSDLAFKAHLYLVKFKK